MPLFNYTTSSEGHKTDKGVDILSSTQHVRLLHCSATQSWIAERSDKRTLYIRDLNSTELLALQCCKYTKVAGLSFSSYAFWRRLAIKQQAVHVSPFPIKPFHQVRFEFWTDIVACQDAIIWIQFA